MYRFSFEIQKEWDFRLAATTMRFLLSTTPTRTHTHTRVANAAF